MFRFVGKLLRGDIVKVVTRKADHPEHHVHDGNIHTVVVEEVRNDKQYFVRCMDPAHANTNWVNILEDVNVWWDETPESIKEVPVNRFKVLKANFLKSDDSKAEFQVEVDEFVVARSFEEVLEAFPKGEFGYLMVINRDTKERKIWEYDRAKWVANPKGKEITIHRRGPTMVKSLCFTGHRPKTRGVTKLPGGYDNLKHPGRVWIHRQIRALLTRLAPQKVITGGALGIDQEAFDIAWDLMEQGLIEEVWIYVPCKDQDSTWPPESKKRYQAQLAKAAARGWVKQVSDAPYAGALMQKRNVAMVNDSDAIVAIWDGSDGGTGNCVAYGKSKGRLIHRINPKDAPSAPSKAQAPERFEDSDDEEIRHNGTLSFKGHVRFDEGPAAGGYVLKDNTGKVIVKFGFSIGRNSLQAANYRALIAGLIQATEAGITDIELRSSATTVLNQLKSDGCSDHRLMSLYNEALDRLTYFRTVLFTKVSSDSGDSIVPTALAEKAHG